MVKEPAAFIIRERGNDRIFLMNEGDTNRRVLTLFLIGTAVYGLTLILCLIRTTGATRVLAEGRPPLGRQP